MSDSANQKDTSQGSQGGRKSLNWPTIRKLEALIFLAMFLLVPLFAIRVLQYTNVQLVVRNLGQELVHDLHRAKALAVESKEDVEVTGSSLKNKALGTYVIIYDAKVREVIVLPQGVTVVGSVTFKKSGRPL